MKKNILSKILLAVILISALTNSQAQVINSITRFPLNPTTTDTIYFYADVSFPTGNCDEATLFSGVLNQDVFAGAIHCLGILTFICNHTDTFKIDPLPAGNYHFTLQEDYGLLPSPCINIGAGATDSVAFTVISTSSVFENSSQVHNLFMYPNPASTVIKLQVGDDLKNARSKMLNIFSCDGKSVGNYALENSTTEFEINISKLQAGIYFCNVTAENTVSEKVKLIVIK